VLEAAAALIGLALTRLELEAELAANERARAALAGRILEEATHERNRIALELHDDVLPLFAAAQMKVDMLDLAVERGDPEQAHGMIEGATQAVEQGIAELRDTLEALRRSTLVPGSLVEALQRLVAELPSRSGVRGELAAPDPMPPLPFTVELLVYETMRGCIANVEKHSEASTVWIELSDADGKLVALMRDDGRGFDPTTIGQRSHGLALIRQRAELARGRFDICSSPGDGTSVRLEVPIW
jgi:signal transduction histidine kinase